MGGGRADKQRMGGWEADGLTSNGWADGGEWCWTDCPKDKTSQLMRQLTWPLKIHRVRPWVSVKTSHSPPPSQ